MDRKEAILRIKNHMEHHGIGKYPHLKLKEALDMAIAALFPPNEPLTLISMSDEIPPDNERVLVYRPCMVNSDTGPYSVQWGWAAKRDGSHWARLPDRRPPEGEA